MAEVAVREKGREEAAWEVCCVHEDQEGDGCVAVELEVGLGVGDDEVPWSEATTLPESPSESVSGGVSLAFFSPDFLVVLILLARGFLCFFFSVDLQVYCVTRSTTV